MSPGYRVRLHASDYDPSRHRAFVIGGDVGGTNINLMLAGVGDEPEMVASLHFATKDHRTLREPLEETLAYCQREYSRPVRGIALAVAGPVREHRWCRLTNADLTVDADEIRDAFGLETVVINDFEALGFAIPLLERRYPQSLSPLERERAAVLPPKDAASESRGVKAVLGPGTGLGKSILVYDRAMGFHIPLPSEGGHTDFPAQNQRQWELVEYVKGKTRISSVAYEDLLSGRGLASLYSFLRLKENHPETRFTREIDAAEYKAPLISRYWTEDTYARRASELFVELLAQCARNLALEVLAPGGVYLAGGIAIRNPGWFTGGRFIGEFENHPTYRHLLQRMPVYLITDYDASMYGAALVATKAQLLKEIWL